MVRIRLSTRWIARSAVVGLALVLAPHLALGQYSLGIGGVGRDIDPGKLRGVGGLQPIGGFQRVHLNPLLHQLARSYRPGPAPSFMIGEPMPNRRGGARFGSVRGEYDLDALDMGSYRQEGSIGQALSRRQLGFVQDTPGSFFGAPAGRRGMSVLSNLALSGMGEDPLLFPKNPRRALARYNAVDAFARQRPRPSGDLAPSLLRRMSSRGVVGNRYSSTDTRGEPVDPMTYAQAELTVRQQLQAERKAGADGARAPRGDASIAELVRSRIRVEWQSKISRGWSEFRRGDYRRAYESFAVAESITQESPEARIGMLFSAIATERYFVAAHSLGVLIERHPDELLNAADIRQQYGSTTDYTAHVTALQNYANANPAVRDLGALWAFAQWGQGDRSGARFTAVRVAEGALPGSPFQKLAMLFEKASTGTGATPAGNAGPDLPFDLRDTGSP